MSPHDPKPLNAVALVARLENSSRLNGEPLHRHLISIITHETRVSSSGYPFISGGSYRLFVDKIPHLFRVGDRILVWLRRVEAWLQSAADIPQNERESLNRAIRVVRTVVYTAGVTAPPDLWVARQILSTHHELGILQKLLDGEAVEPRSFAQREGLAANQLSHDLHFLHSRGYLVIEDGRFLLPPSIQVRHALDMVQPLEEAWRVDLVNHLRETLSGENESHRDMLVQWMVVNAPDRCTETWVADYHRMEIGYRVTPIVLALRALNLTKSLKEDVSFTAVVQHAVPGMKTILDQAGYLDDDRVTELGARVFQRGPGPFGIIGTYFAYMNQLGAILRMDATRSWVSRGENVAASQDANRKTFKAANDALDRFCEKTRFNFDVFIEHAVGKGEATRQRFERDPEGRISYFGADLEDAAINEAKKNKQAGVLPANMAFISGADIGDPGKVIDFLEAGDTATERAVMMVGNGFHEIRDQSNEKMIEAFKGYCDAGIILIFTEESALSDRDLLNTAWNTYHAGFRYVHELSGQGLRPVWKSAEGHDRLSWSECAEKAGYKVLDDYSYRTRTIYPFKKMKRTNPSISFTYFCVPAHFNDLLKALD